MQTAIIAGLVFRHALERLVIDARALGEMLGCVDDVIEALRGYQEEMLLHEAHGLAQAAADAPLSKV